MQIICDKRTPMYLLEFDGKDTLEIHTRESFVDWFKDTDWVKKWEHDVSPIEWIDNRHFYPHGDFHIQDTYVWGGLMINRIV
jgi:hypothetical protein